MNNETQSKQRDTDIERLLRAGGGRKEPPSAMRDRVYAATETAWRELPDEPVGDGATSTTGPRFGWQALSAAAGLMLAVGVALYAVVLSPGKVATDDAVGRIVFAPRGVEVNGQDRGEDVTLRTGDRLLVPGDGHVSLRLRGGAKLALAPTSRLQMEADSSVHLLSGKAYFDVQGQEASVRVHTPHMQLVDIGTQFLVEVTGNDTTVAVREGQVEITAGSDQLLGAAQEGRGDLMTFAGTRLVSRETVEATGAYWHWARGARPPLSLAGTTVFDYLSWLARDTGREIAYASRSVELLARGEQLRDIGADIDSDDVPVDEVLETTRFVIADTGDRVWNVAFRR